MNWILVALLEPVFYAWANILDSNLTNRIFKYPWILTVFVAVANALFMPLLLGIHPLRHISFEVIPYIFLVAFIELYYGYPYYKALENDDTSVAVSLFSLGKIFVPILAFIFLGESLQLTQYAGFFLIVISAAALTYAPRKNIRFNKSFFYMLLSSSLLAVEIVLYKHIFNSTDWLTGFFWVSIISACMGLCSLLLPGMWLKLKNELPALKSRYGLVLLVGGLGFLGSIGLSYAASQVSATVSRTIGSLQPFLVLLYAILFYKRFPSVFKENVDLRNILKKILFFLFTALGIFLTIR